jgi:poly(A) polymerase
MRATLRLIQHGFEAYLVGGCVRDLLLGRSPKDYDIATEARPQQVKRTFPRNCRIIGRRFKLAHLHFHGNTKILEVSTFRRSPQNDGPDPEENGVAEGDPDRDLLITRDNEFGTAEQDAMRRDFTVNALFLDPKRNRILDYCEGLQDVRNKVIRTIGDPVVRFREDPVRILRAVKFAGRLGFSIEPATLAAMATTAGDLARAAPPRLLEEILRLLRGGHALDSFQILRDVGALRTLLPVLADFLGSATIERRIAFWRLLEALDHQVLSGDTPQNGVLLACLFVEPVLAYVAAHPGRSAASVAEHLLGSLGNDLRLPRRDAGCLKRICAVQHRFASPDGQGFHLGGFVGGPFFAEALQLFGLRAHAAGDDETLLERWQELASGRRGRSGFVGEGADGGDESDVDLAGEPQAGDDLRAPADGGASDPFAAPGDGGGRRRRRRRRRGGRDRFEDRDDAGPAADLGQDQEQDEAAAHTAGQTGPRAGSGSDDDQVAEGQLASAQPARTTNGEVPADEDEAAAGEDRDEASGSDEAPGEGQRRRRRRRRRRGRHRDGEPFPASPQPSPHGDAVDPSAHHDHAEAWQQATAPQPDPGAAELDDTEDTDRDPADADLEVAAADQATAEGLEQGAGEPGSGRRRKRRRRRGRRDGPGEPGVQQQAQGAQGQPGPRAERQQQATGHRHPQQRQQQQQQQQRQQPRGQRQPQPAGGRDRQDRHSRRDRRNGGHSDVDVVPRHRDRRGKVEVIEPPPLDLSAFDVELDPKRVPTFGSIVEGKGRPKQRTPRVPEDGNDSYRPPPPPGSDLGPGAPPPPPPSDDTPDTFGDW